MTGRDQSNGENDPIKMWQNQPREEILVTLKMIHEKAEKLRARTRRELFGNVATTALSVGIAWFGWEHTHDLGFQCAFVASAGWALIGLYFVHRGMWAATPPERSALMTGVDFYRREINRRRNLVGRFLQWNLGPVVLSLGTLTLALAKIAENVDRPRAVLPFTTLAIIWLLFVFVLRSRNQRELKQEVDQLNEIEKAGNGIKSA
jgi:hypothetical protein